MTRITTTQRLVFGILIAGLAVFGSRFLMAQQEVITPAKSKSAIPPVAVEAKAATNSDKSTQTTGKRTTSSISQAPDNELIPKANEMETPSHSVRIEQAVSNATKHMDSVGQQLASFVPSNQKAESKQKSSKKQTPQKDTTAAFQRRPVPLALQAPPRDAEEKLRKLNELRQWSLRMQAANAQAEARQSYYRSQQQAYQAQRNAQEATRREMNRFHRQVGGRMAARGVQW